MQFYLLPYYQQAHRVMLPLLWLLFLCSLGLAPIHGTMVWALVIGLPAALLPSLVIWRAPQAFAARALVAVSFMVFAALLIHQSGAMTEMHFGIFVLLAFLLCYRDWKVILVGAAMIAVHHLSFSYLQEWGYGVLCFTEPGLGEVLLHALFVVVEAGVLAYLAVVLHRDAVQAGELHARVAAMTGRGDGTIDLAQEAQAAESEAGQRLQAMLAALHHALGQVRDGTRVIATAAEHIATSNHELASRTEEQGNALTETASAVVQVTAAVQNSTQYAEQADALARCAVDIAERGSHEVARVVATMGSISAASQKIADIIGVIDGIAFQTNLLALNASVEAARAGEAGRGFAVVAGEVRTLASRAANASREINQLINASVQEVGTGSDLVAQAGRTMTEVTDSIRRVTASMASIRESAREQRSAIEHINDALTEMDTVTQQNVAMVDAAASTSATLHEQVQRLVEAVRVFRLRH